MPSNESPSLSPHKTILITGSNRGIGLGLAQGYLSAGWQVIATARNPKSANAFEALNENYGDQFTAVSLDVNDEVSIAELPQRIGEVELHCVINNAGVCVEEGLGEWTAAGLDTNLRVNAIGPALVTQALQNQLKDGGSLVSITSGMGSLELNINAQVGLDGYAMSKAALNILNLRIAEKLRERSIIVASISPGWVRTEMGGAEASTSIDEAIESLMKTISELTMDHTGGFFSETGVRIPW